MKLLKNSAIAFTLALSLATFAPPTFAVCLGMACMYNNLTPIEGINATKDQIAKAMLAISSNADADVIVNDIKEALKISKEINANDKVDRNRNRANGYLKQSRKSVKDGNLTEAMEHLKEADKLFADLKGMLNLSLSDREKQQTHMLDR